MDKEQTNEYNKFNRTLLIRSDSAYRNNGSRKEVKMSEITKLYENAGLSNMWVQRYNDGYYEHERHYNSYKEMINNMMKANDWTLTEAQEVAKRECKKELPPFTAEKQIELIKWLSSKYGLYIVDKYSIGFGECIGDFCIKEDFEEALAGSVNSLWQDLTEKEKQQVKGILE